MRRRQNTVIVIFNAIRLNFCKLCFLDVCVSKYLGFIHQFIKRMCLFLPLCPTFGSLSFYPCQSPRAPPPSTNPSSSLCLIPKAEVMLPSSSIPRSQDDIITQQPCPWQCLFITLIIIGNISSITCVSAHASAYT